MTEGGIFRELFVELSEQAMAIARGIGEEAVHRAEALHAAVNPARSESTAAATVMQYVFRERYGISGNIAVLNCALDRAWVISFRDACSHRQRIIVPEEIWYAARGSVREHAAALIHHLDGKRNERSCYCVPRIDDQWVAP